MFHVLADKAAKFLKAASEVPATKVFCGVSTPREAISQARFDSYQNSGKLRTNRICQVCHRRALNGFATK